jgi:hypothetical protein
MLEAKPRLKSFDSLARICTNSADWPASARMGPRSLAAIFSKLDRDEGLGWLAGRPEVQLELARVLGSSREVLRLALTPRHASEPNRFITWDTLPYARVLDLVEEPPFPGVPSEVLHPGAWQKLVWVAPNGGGRSIVGHWLEARGLARHVSAPNVAAAAIPAARPLFVELGSASGLDLGALAPGVCVAVPEPFPSSATPRGVTLVRSPPVADVLDELLGWCRARLSARSGLDPERLARFLRSGPLEAGAVQSVGDVLGLAGLADELGTEAFETKPLARLAHDFVRRRGAERLDPDGPSTPWARRSGFDALVAILRRFAIEEGEDPFLPRSSEEWSLALPPELKQGPDLEWLRTALPGADPELLRSDVERAVVKLPPGAFRLLRTFEALGLLERSADGLLALRPHWLVRAAGAEALAELVDGPPAGFGEALLSRKAAPAAFVRLLARARGRTLAPDDFVLPEGDDSPVHAAAVEGAFRAVGLAALTGAEVAPELAETLWDDEQRLLFEPPGELPAPRIEHALSSRDGEPGAWMLGRGAFYLAALALGESLEAGQGRTHALLRPWHATTAPAKLDTLLDVVHETLEHPGVPAELAAAAAALVSRLRSVLGPLGENGEQHALERASIVADETGVGVLAWRSVAALGADRVARAGTRHLVETRKLEHAFAEAVWQAHRDAGAPEAGTEALFSRELAPLVLPEAPVDALAPFLALIVERDELFALVRDRLEKLFEAAPSDAPLALFSRVPEITLDAALALAVRAKRADALALLWERFPAALGRRAALALAATSDASKTTLAPLLESAPPEATEPLVRALVDVDALMKTPAETLSAVRALLHRRLAARAPGWREAYALFSEVERRFRAVSRATSRL